jgi:hypothetical protein
MEISKEKLRYTLKNIRRLSGGGGDGTCYYNPKIDKVIKIFHCFDEPFLYDYPSKEEVLKFNSIELTYFIFPIDVITVNGHVVGYIADYIKAKNLYKTNPLDINLLEFMTGILNMYKDIIKISNEGIVIYDLIYNLMQNKNELYAIDTDDYFFSDKDDILKRNVNTFNESIMIFLVDNYFDEFVQSNKKLLEMYKGKNINLVDFITLFYKLLSENIGKDIITLNDAKSLVNKKYYEPNFIRSIKK